MYYKRNHRHAPNYKGLSAAPPIDWAGILQGTVKPQADFNVLLDKDTKKALYIAFGGLGAAILVSAIVGKL